MQSSNHIGTIVRQHADAVESGKTGKRKQKAGAAKSSAFTSVPKHRAFVPMVTIWGGLLLALITAALPDQPIARASSLTGVYLPLLMTRLILATVIGLAGALLGYIVAKSLSNQAKMAAGDGGLVSAFKSRDLQPINPVADLGSESLDAPIKQVNEPEVAEFSEMLLDNEVDEYESAPEGETPAGPSELDALAQEPTLGELAQRGFEMEAPEDMSETTGEDNDADNARHKKGSWAFTRRHFKDALIESCEGATCEAAYGAETGPETRGPESRDPEFSTPQARPTKNREAAALTPENTTPHTRNKSRAKKMGAQKPRALDLNEFASMPGRNGVWVDEPAQELPAQATVPSKQDDPASALEKLRQKPTEHLSLVEMVERFAGALHEHQAQERARFAEGEIAREAALAEALKALSLFTQGGFDQGNRALPLSDQMDQTEDQLRSALTRLQDLRGAA